MTAFNDILGQKFNKLVAIERGTNGPTGKWLFRCDCGTEKWINKHNVIYGKTTSCGCAFLAGGHARLQDITGKRFGRLVVQSLKERVLKTKWLCLCDCGNEIVVDGGNLASKHTTSCGCLRIFRHKAGDVGKKLLYYRYKLRSKQKGYQFNIPFEDFILLTSEECHYCGRRPETISKSKSDNSAYLYNGLDRVDCSLGYIKENVVTCCELCNKMKMDLSVAEFKSHIIALHNAHNPLGE